MINLHRVQLDIEEMKRARFLIAQAERILIISHRNPDADSIGCNVAMHHVLQSKGKIVTSACIDIVPDNLKFLPLTSEFQNNVAIDDFDLLITVDCGASGQVRFQEKDPLFLKTVPVINFDHHATNDYFGTVNIVDPDAAATGLILFYFFEFCGFALDSQTATALATALYYDTGSFKHSNTTPEVLQVMNVLTKAGANLQKIVSYLFKTASVSKLKLWGRALSRARLNSKGVLVSLITADDFFELGIDPNELSGVIDYLNTLPESRFCILLSEDLKGNIKGSCRTQHDEVDLSVITSIFGGGGHKKAAGFSLPGHLSRNVTVE